MKDLNSQDQGRETVEHRAAPRVQGGGAAGRVQVRLKSRAKETSGKDRETKVTLSVAQS